MTRLVQLARPADLSRIAARGRRDFLAWLGAAPLVVGCAAESGEADPAEDTARAEDEQRADGGADGGEVCRATTRDAEGPYYSAGAPSRVRIADDREPGVRLVMEGRLLGPDCRRPLVGYVLDIWQADAEGEYHDAGSSQYRLRGKVVSDAQGRYRFETILPGRYGDASGIRPAHIHAKVRTPMGNTLLTTQLYFEGDPYLGEADYCTRQGTCNSSDAARILRLSTTVLSGRPAQRTTFDAFLART